MEHFNKLTELSNEEGVLIGGFTVLNDHQLAKLKGGSGSNGGNNCQCNGSNNCQCQSNNCNCFQG
jgi:hypothetical protein